LTHCVGVCANLLSDIVHVYAVIAVHYHYMAL